MYTCTVFTLISELTWKCSAYFQRTFVYGTLVETSVYATLFLEYPLDENRLEMFLMVLIQRFLSYLNYSFISLIFSALLIREAFL